jgi:hypothetical protein
LPHRTTLWLSLLKQRDPIGWQPADGESEVLSVFDHQMGYLSKTVPNMEQFWTSVSLCQVDMIKNFRLQFFFASRIFSPFQSDLRLATFRHPH